MSLFRKPENLTHTHKKDNGNLFFFTTWLIPPKKFLLHSKYAKKGSLVILNDVILRLFCALRFLLCSSTNWVWRNCNKKFSCLNRQSNNITQTMQMAQNSRSYTLFPSSAIFKKTECSSKWKCICHGLCNLFFGVLMVCCSIASLAVCNICLSCSHLYAFAS